MSHLRKFYILTILTGLSEIDSTSQCSCDYKIFPTIKICLEIYEFPKAETQAREKTEKLRDLPDWLLFSYLHNAKHLNL